MIHCTGQSQKLGDKWPFISGVNAAYRLFRKPLKDIKIMGFLVLSGSRLEDSSSQGVAIIIVSVFA